MAEDDCAEDEDLAAEQDEELEAGISLEELSQSYADALSCESDADQPSAEASQPTQGQEQEQSLGLFDPLANQQDDEETCPTTPSSIIEAVLFVGREDNQAISAAELAALMRGVDEAEVEQLIEELNEQYEQTGRAIRIVEAGVGYKVELWQQLEPVREQFYGRVRDIRLSQAAIDCLALIAYQPGISRTKLEEQRGAPSGGILSQLVRRELLEMRREDGTGKAKEPHYYPTQKLIELVGLGSIEDLPQVEEW